MKLQTVKFVSPVVDPSSPNRFERKDFGPLVTPRVTIEAEGGQVTLTATVGGKQTVVFGIGYEGCPFSTASVSALTVDELLEAARGPVSANLFELDEPKTSVEKFKTVPPLPMSSADVEPDFDTQPGIIRRGSVGQVHPRERVKPTEKTKRKGDV